MDNLHDYAKSELKLAGMFDRKSDYGGMMADAIMKMIDAFADEGHSGMSAAMAIDIFQRLARFEPLTPLTGADHEWHEVGKGVFQNRRCSHVFKENGRAYDIEGRIFRYPDGVCVTRFGSRVPVTFPYTPKREYVEIQADD
jgi:hypothetical protein